MQQAHVSSALRLSTSAGCTAAACASCQAWPTVTASPFATACAAHDKAHTVLAHAAWQGQYSSDTRLCACRLHLRHRRVSPHEGAPFAGRHACMHACGGVTSCRRSLKVTGGSCARAWACSALAGFMGARSPLLACAHIPQYPIICTSACLPCTVHFTMAGGAQSDMGRHNLTSLLQEARTAHAQGLSISGGPQTPAWKACGRAAPGCMCARPRQARQRAASPRWRPPRRG